MTLRDLPISSREEVSKKETVKQSCHCEPKQHLPQKPLALFSKEMGTNCQNGTQCKYPSRPGFAMSSPCIQKKWIERHTNETAAAAMQAKRPTPNSFCSKDMRGPPAAIVPEERQRVTLSGYDRSTVTDILAWGVPCANQSL
jgi:hypothetical protein